MDDKPAFRRETSSELTLQPSPETVELSNAYKRRRAPSRAWSAERVTEEAKDRVVASVGDPGNAQLVLSESTVQYRGETFKWLLTHDVGYVGYRDGSSSPGQEDQCLVGLGNTRVSRIGTCMRLHPVEAWEQDGGTAKVHPVQRCKGEQPSADALRNRSDYLPICACSGTSAPSSRCLQPSEFQSQVRTGAFRCLAAVCIHGTGR
ncbi:hypothetical protein P4O66_014314 [Electrophorus voltai]|uniref:Uncharacterized protein n=1 Tax=Electrophorus voltai TaxID=2609070 RepID=A0AAD9DRE7_9TELE|nr:hypothetical protein P4O66_014314 [Electrophorus voltai]